MTAAGLESATRGSTGARSGWSRAAAVASVLLGVTLLVVLPQLAAAAFYVGVLAAVAALLATGAGCTLLARGGLLVRTGAVVAAASTLVAQLIEVLVGLPGAPDLHQMSSAVSGLTLGLAAAVLGLLALDALRHTPQTGPDQPYAL